MLEFFIFLESPSPVGFVISAVEAEVGTLGAPDARWACRGCWEEAHWKLRALNLQSKEATL